MENGERITWPMESITLTKSEVLDLVAVFDVAIDELGISMTASDLVELRNLLLDRLEGR